jgi:hypothetical protein
MITSFFKPKRTRAAVADEENGANAKGKADVQTKKQKTTTNNNNADDNEKTKIKTTKDDASSPDTTTEVLISHLSDPSNSNGDDDDDVAPTWRSALDKHFSSPSFKRLAAFVDTERYVTSIVCAVPRCAVLYCIVLYYIVLYCIALHCIVLHCIVLYCIVSNMVGGSLLARSSRSMQLDSTHGSDGLFFMFAFAFAIVY